MKRKLYGLALILLVALPLSYQVLAQQDSNALTGLITKPGSIHSARSVVVAYLSADQSHRDQFKRSFVNVHNLFFKSEQHLQRWTLFFGCLDAKFAKPAGGLGGLVDKLFLQARPHGCRTRYIHSGDTLYYQYGQRSSFPQPPAKEITAREKGRTTQTLLAERSVLRDSQRVMIVLDGSSSMWDTFGKLPSNGITSLLRVDDKIWMGTADGLAILDQKGNVIEKHFAVDNCIYDLLLVGDQIWAATDHGIVIYNKDRSQPLPIEKVLDVHVYSLLSVGNLIWVATPQGLLVLNQEGTINQVPEATANRFITDLVQVKDKIVVEMGYDFVIFAQDNPDKTASSQIKSRKQIISSVLPVGPYIWLGTDKGLFIVDQKGKEKKLFFDNVVVHNILNVGEQIWVAKENGLAIFNQDGQIISEGMAGLPSQQITHILPVENNLWVATHSGLAIMHQPNNDGRWQVRSVVSNEIPYFHLACDAALNTLDLMNNATASVAIVLTTLDDKNPVVLNPWSNVATAQQKIAWLRQQANDENLASLAENNSFISNPEMEEGMAPLLKAMAELSDEEPDLMLFMHDGGLSDQAMKQEIEESAKLRNFPIHFKPFAPPGYRYQVYFNSVPQKQYKDVVLANEF